MKTPRVKDSWEWDTHTVSSCQLRALHWETSLFVSFQCMYFSTGSGSSRQSSCERSRKYKGASIYIKKRKKERKRKHKLMFLPAIQSSHLIFALTQSWAFTSTYCMKGLSALDIIIDTYIYFPHTDPFSEFWPKTFILFHGCLYINGNNSQFQPR